MPVTGQGVEESNDIGLAVLTWGGRMWWAGATASAFSHRPVSLRHHPGGPWHSQCPPLLAGEGPEGQRTSWGHCSNGEIWGRVVSFGV